MKSERCRDGQLWQLVVLKDIYNIPILYWCDHYGDSVNEHSAASLVSLYRYNRYRSFRKLYLAASYVYRDGYEHCILSTGSL